MSDEPKVEVVRGLTSLVTQAERIIQHVFDEAEKKIREGKSLDISIRDAIYIAVRLAELRLGLPPPAPPRRERDLKKLTLEELKKYRELVAKTTPELTKKLDS